jgi:hypothetical protein
MARDPTAASVAIAQDRISEKRFSPAAASASRHSPSCAVPMTRAASIGR